MPNAPKQPTNEEREFIKAFEKKFYLFNQNFERTVPKPNIKLLEGIKQTPDGDIVAAFGPRKVTMVRRFGKPDTYTLQHEIYTLQDLDNCLTNQSEETFLESAPLSKDIAIEAKGALELTALAIKEGNLTLSDIPVVMPETNFPANIESVTGGSFTEKEYYNYLHLATKGKAHTFAWVGLVVDKPYSSKTIEIIEAVAKAKAQYALNDKPELARFSDVKEQFAADKAKVKDIHMALLENHNLGSFSKLTSF
jgi:hypothetical protein